MPGRWDIVAAVSLGGALGSLARWGVSTLLPHDARGFPWSTFVENLSGALALGVLAGLLGGLLGGGWSAGRYLRPFLGVGVLGGYTTFSTYAFDAHELLRAGQLLTTLVYLGGTLVAGLVAAWTGLAAGRFLVEVVRG